MNWIETLSPSLPRYLDAWVNLRGARKVPPLDQFPEFMKMTALDFTAVIGISEDRECTFSHVGSSIVVLYPGCEKGTRFASLSPVTLRLTSSRPINEVITTRQPTTRRSTYRISDSETFFEQLHLPFVDKNSKVRRVAIVGDG